MGVLLKIAYRNLKEHKVKTLIVGSIIMLGLLILVIGNSLIDTAAEGVRSMYTSNFTGQRFPAAVQCQYRRISADVPGQLRDARMVVLVGILASLYPLAVALRINPVRAMNQH